MVLYRRKNNKTQFFGYTFTLKILPSSQSWLHLTHLSNAVFLPFKNNLRYRFLPCVNIFRMPECDVSWNIRSTGHTKDIKFFLQDRDVWECCIWQHNFLTQKGGSFEHFWEFLNASSICCHWHTNDTMFCFLKNKLLIAIVKRWGNLFSKKTMSPDFSCCRSLLQRPW